MSNTKVKIDVRKVAKLANLTLTDEEVKKFEDQLGNILGYIEELEKVDTSGVEPTSQTTGLTNITRIDEIKVDRILNLEEVFANTVKKHNNYFVVDAVIDKDN